MKSPALFPIVSTLAMAIASAALIVVGAPRADVPEPIHLTDGPSCSAAGPRSSC